MKSLEPAILISALGVLGAGHAAFGQASTRGAEARELPAAVASAGRGNPLWAIPLESLHETRDRPLFSATRRPPAPVVAEAPKVSAPPPPPPPEPEKPQFTLVGVVHGPRLDLAVFFDLADKSLARLRVGQSVGGWTVRGVDTRTATLEKAQQQVKLELPARNTQTAATTLSPAEITAAAAALDQ